jgi:hypothetical protein
VRTLWMMALMAGCGDKDTTDSGEDGPGLADGVRYPSGEEIMIFTGHDGADGDGGAPGGMDLVKAHWESTYGYTVRYKDELPSEVIKYRAIVMMAPGYFGGAAPFIKSEVLQLKEMLAQGSRIIILAESGTCGDAQVNQLLTDLGSTIQLSGSGADSTRLIQVAKFNYDSQVTRDVTGLQIHGPCYVDPGADGDPLFADDDGNVLAAVQYPGPGGDIVVIGDFRFVDDTGYREEADNAILSDNLITIVP